MRNLRKSLILLISLSFMFIFPSSILATTTEKFEKETETEVIIEKNKSGDKTDPKSPIYTPDPAKSVKILPQTGEMIQTFIFVVIGLSCLLFFVGLVVNKSINQGLRWELNS